MSLQKPSLGTSAATARLRAAFAAAVVDDQALRTDVGAFVDEMKALHWPVERIIVTIKRLAEAEAEVAAVRDPAAVARGMRDRQQAVSRAVVWCIKHYFAADDDSRERPT
jgi:hypothetical protein